MSMQPSPKKATRLALDLGTQTGWAIGAPSGITSGTHSFKPGRFEGGGMRFLRFQRWLDELHQLTRFSEVHFEEVRRHTSTDSAHVYGGLLGQLTAWCELHRIPYAGVPVGTIKRAIAGKGNASKDEVIAAVRVRGYTPRDDNEADALALLLTLPDALYPTSIKSQPSE
jgi:Holliday junction resolvasome RuvABC endonuclease subunit